MGTGKWERADGYFSSDIPLIDWITKHDVKTRRTDMIARASIDYEAKVQACFIVLHLQTLSKNFVLLTFCSTAHLVEK